MKKIALLIGMAVLPALVNAEETNLDICKPLQVVNPRDLNQDCHNQIFPQPDGAYAAMVFCEAAHGDYLAVIRNGRIGGPEEGPWEMGKRIWQDTEWASDVTSFAWSSDGKYLFVGEGGIYGNCGLYVLDLEKRVARKVFPKTKSDEECVFIDVEILKITPDAIRIRYDTDTGDEKKDVHGKTLTLKFKKTGP